jgi:prepilin-type processing-associated H-X9-DG protein
MKRSLRPHAFSLTELLIISGIIVLLVTLMLPVIAKVRVAARSTRCLANLQQWGYSFQMYLNANSGQTISEPSGAGLKHLEWWEILKPYNANVQLSLLCPDGSEPSPRPHGRQIKGTASAFWELNTERGRERGSYGFNEWIESPFPPHRSDQADYFHFPAPNPEQIPLIGDACQFRVDPRNGDPVPTNLQIPTPANSDQGVAELCLDRHAMAVNVVFLDGHAEHVLLPQLWALKWSPNFVRRTVVVHRK